jgi:hypothetical protein
MSLEKYELETLRRTEIAAHGYGVLPRSLATISRGNLEAIAVIVRQKAAELQDALYDSESV